MAQSKPISADNSDHIFNKALGIVLTAIRESRGETQQEWAERFSKAGTTVSGWENDPSHMTVRDLMTFSRFGGSELAEVIGLAQKIALEIHTIAAKNDDRRLSPQAKGEVVEKIQDLLAAQDLPIGEINLFNKVSAALQPPSRSLAE